MLSISGSDAIKAVGYSPQTGTMRIEFNHGDEKSKRYRFCGVPQQVFDGLLYAPSKGNFYDNKIRGKYLCYNE